MLLTLILKDLMSSKLILFVTAQYLLPVVEFRKCYTESINQAGDIRDEVFGSHCVRFQCES